MVFWIYMFIMCLLLPFTMIGLGRYFLRNAPKNINAVFGYRTTMSMKNKDTWEFSHKYFGKIWYTCGLVLLPLSIVPMLFVIGQDKDTIGILGGLISVIQLILLIGPILPTEKALKKNFDENGNRR